MSTGENDLLRLLPNNIRARLVANCVEVDMRRQEVIYNPTGVIRYVYFPTKGFVSLVASLAGTPGLEVGIVGDEGMVGAQLVLGVTTSPLRVVVQGAGTALRIPADAFREQLDVSTELKGVLDRYIATLITQSAISAACARYHGVSPRLARWLLMCQDRAKSESFKMTQEFLAYMLGVRRASVTDAASALQRAGVIRYRRGELIICDRSGLERAACGCYFADQKYYRHLLGHPNS